MSNGLTSVDAVGKRQAGDAAPDAGIPILGVADTTTPAAVDDGDAVLVLTDLYGRLKVVLDSAPIAIPVVATGDVCISDVISFATVAGQSTSAASFPVVLSSDQTYNLGTIDVPTASPSISNVIIAAPDTEYSLAFPNYCRRVEFQCRDASDVLYAFTTGNVSWPTDPYMTLKSGGSYDSGRIYQALAPSTLYLASDLTGATVEVITWT